MRSKLDSEIKLEILIKLAFGISIEELMKEYNLTKAKIVNLRKNNYKLYNEFFDYWKIDKEVAVLELSPKYERALSIAKKHYKDNLVIKSIDEIYLKGKKCSSSEFIDIADNILQKDNIRCFKEMPIYIKNHY
jgi:arginine utilization protein RocB